jgi:hypothetical protein
MMPDFLVFAAVAPKLRGSRIIAFTVEPTPELDETLFEAIPTSSVLARSKIATDRTPSSRRHASCVTKFLTCALL